MAQKTGLSRGSDSKIADRSRYQFLIIIGIFVVIILGIIAFPYYQTYVAPFNRIIITVDNIKIPMKYFLHRTRLSGSDAMSMLQLLTNEQLIKLAAPGYGIKVTEKDIVDQLKNTASDGEGNISDVEFNEWYRQQLNNTRMSDSQYREMVSMELLINRLQAYLAERVPDKAEQVHLHIILVQKYEEAQKAAERLKAGESFASVARKVSIDPGSREKGGDLGWQPVSISIFKDQISSLGINEISDPYPYYNKTASESGRTSKAPDAYYIIKISEKDNARLVTDEHMQVLKASALEFWLQEEIQRHDVKYDFNSEIYAWINWQLQKK